MYQVGDLIIYGGEGVCRVAAVGPAPIAAADPSRLYYTLTPVYRKGVVYAPTDVDVPMRPVLSREESLSLIRSIPTMDRDTMEFADAKQAALEYKALLQPMTTGTCCASSARSTQKTSGPSPRAGATAMWMKNSSSAPGSFCTASLPFPWA